MHSNWDNAVAKVNARVELELGAATRPEWLGGRRKAIAPAPHRTAAQPSAAPSWDKAVARVNAGVR